MFVLLLIEYIKDRLSQKIVRLLSLKKAPLGKKGINRFIKNMKQPICI